MKWFIPIPETAEELKKAYRKLAMKYHPDMGGTDAEMQEINNEYEQLFARLKDVHKNVKGETYTAKEATAETPAEFIEIISKIINLQGVDIEICGSWIWLHGNTKEYKDIFKALKFRWSANKKSWYWHADGYKRRSRGKYTMDEIRDMWGSAKIKQNAENGIAVAYA